MNLLVSFGFKELDENELLSISAIEFFERYEVKTISTKHLGHDNIICCRAMDHEFIIKPYNGKPDWETLLKRLERGKYGVFTLLERLPEKE